jgi:hypothetical protein
MLLEAPIIYDSITVQHTPPEEGVMEGISSTEAGIGEEPLNADLSFSETSDEDASN